ncbi:hypothetical protein [Actinoplanes rectilineatus]|uniref:hypothetical protein n=1 Tax=Actinoplanes rectilineatus TaxID=113571 RepID=UPI000B22A770|nr:hypothetical protein [Actinoplanes rectilineatus]
MEPTSNSDSTVPSSGMPRMWQGRPDSLADGVEADVVALGTRGPTASPPDPFGLNKAAGRVGPGTPRPPVAGRPATGAPGRKGHGDTDHSVPPDDETDPGQDVKSVEPESRVGGFRLGNAGRFLFGGRTAPEQDDKAEKAEDAEADTPGSGTAEEPGDTEPDAAPADDQDTAEPAATSDENGREDMNGRAGAPGYAQAGEQLGPDGVPASPAAGTGDELDPGTPVEHARPVAGWASVPSAAQPAVPTSGVPMAGPVSGAPVSPEFPVSPDFPAGPFGVPDFTPDHPAGTLAPTSGVPVPAPAPAPEPRPVAEAAPAAPVSPAVEAPAVASPTMTVPLLQIPATRTPPDAEPAESSTGYAGLPPAGDGSFGFSPTGYSLGRSGEVYGSAAVAPASAPVAPQPVSAAPQAPSVAAPQVEFPVFPGSGAGVTGLAGGGVRRSASLEDVEPARRARRPEDALDGPGDDAGTPRTIWDEDAARHFRAAWHEVKAEFVDDPVTALTRAHDLLTDAVNELTEVLLAERDDLDPLRGTDTPDTESMRMAMRGYREFLDRILSL